MSERLFKVLGPGRVAHYGGTGKWKARAWMPPIEGIKPCVRGYHLCRESDLVGWLGPEIWEAEWRGERIDATDKIVVSEARLVRRLDTWNERTARLFAADCAEAVLHLIPEKQRAVCAETISVARRYANGEATDQERAAAGAAAWDAAGAAAWAAARDAAGAAAWDAARAAAGAAARDAAGAAAKDAAWDAQTEMLMGYLYPKDTA